VFCFINRGCSVSLTGGVLFHYRGCSVSLTGCSVSLTGGVLFH